MPTWLGTVIDNGAPQAREIKSRQTDWVSGSADAEQLVVSGGTPWCASEQVCHRLFIRTLLGTCVPTFAEPHNTPDEKRLLSNITACQDPDVDADYMKRLIAIDKRVDMEQAAAIVLSAIMTDKRLLNRDDMVRSLIDGIDHSTLVHSCMWIGPDISPPWQTCHQRKGPGQDPASKFQRLIMVIHDMLAAQDITVANIVNEWNSLVILLLRIRREDPFSNRTRCLFIPQWMFETAHITVPADYKVWDHTGTSSPGYEPRSPPPTDAIALPKRPFRALQRRLLSFYRYWIPSINLRKAIFDLHTQAHLCTAHIKQQAISSTDTLLVARMFIALQRRLQTRIFHDDYKISGLEAQDASSGTAALVQNSPTIPTQYERTLAKLAGHVKAEAITAPVLTYIDQCSLLMERYVNLYSKAANDRSNLRVETGKFAPGYWRGPVHDYNRLCGIMEHLKRVAKEQGMGGSELPGLVRRFSTRKAMYAAGVPVEDDAFADGVVHGWEPWLAMRRERGTLSCE